MFRLKPYPACGLAFQPVLPPERRLQARLPAPQNCWLMVHTIRVVVLSLVTAALLPAWTMSVEFPFAALPRPVWERDLAQLKEMGVTHVSLPNTSDVTQLAEVIRIVRTLGLDADLEGPIPDRLQPLAKSHGGPLTEALPGAIRISAIMPRALDNERKLLTSGTQAIVWTDVFETLGLPRLRIIPAPVRWRARRGREPVWFAAKPNSRASGVRRSPRCRNRLARGFLYRSTASPSASTSPTRPPRRPIQSPPGSRSLPSLTIRLTRGKASCA
jgi:hypothetical protein